MYNNRFVVRSIPTPGWLMLVGSQTIATYEHYIYRVNGCACGGWAHSAEHSKQVNVSCMHAYTHRSMHACRPADAWLHHRPLTDDYTPGCVRVCICAHNTTLGVLQRNAPCNAYMSTCMHACIYAATGGSPPFVTFETECCPSIPPHHPPTPPLDIDPPKI
jgi:hypothetical protein